MIFLKKRYFCLLCEMYKREGVILFKAGGVGVCEKCMQKLHNFKDNSFPAPGNIKAVFSAFLYEGAMRKAVKDFKFIGQRQYGVVFGKILADKLRDIEMLKSCDMIIPVPLHPNREIERGYNQSEVLAKELSATLGVPMFTDVLFRIKDTKKQSTLTGLARVENVKDAFIAHNESVRNKRIILVDDVCTMGETLKACENALNIAGAKEVVAVTLCITLEKDIEDITKKNK